MFKNRRLELVCTSGESRAKMVQRAQASFLEMEITNSRCQWQRNGIYLCWMNIILHLCYSKCN